MANEYSILSKLIKASKENQKIIGIRLYDDNDKFWCGYVIDYNEQLILLQHFSRYGQADGKLILAIENIESIDADDDYAKAMQYLINDEVIKDESSIRLRVTENWQYAILKQLLNSDRIVLLDFNGDFSIHGLILDMDETYVRIKPISETGDEDGNSVYRLSDIISIRIANLESVKREKLLSWKQQKL